ncbi:ADP-ribosylation factor-like protein 3 [Scaptodrosophila lebanonensis]|uniref:ADP-ribosylation factor-like protein 6 n=1 Tax=Drosophila lebanonensis TaxID=7225 RepID=A0A6J2T4W5_DROLE|nr:ADP-ribosylation factor-like protein 3 [Scaptodrosophila lebanonensis]
MCLCYILKVCNFFARKLFPQSKPKELRMLVLGLDNAGKTTLVSRLGEEAEGAEITSSFGGALQEFKIKGVKLRLWDLSGQWGNRQIWCNYYSSTNALIYVIDSTDAQRLGEARSELCEMLLDKRLDDVPLLILANKQDQVGALPTADVAELLGLTRLEKRNWIIQDCSAVTGNGLEQAMEWIYQTMET